MMQPKFSNKRVIDGMVYTRMYITPNVNEAISYKNNLRNRGLKVRIVNSSPTNLWYGVYARR